MKTYSSYTDSKIDWVGEIPSHWNLNKIKYIFFQRKEKNDPIQTDNILSLTIQQGVIPLSEKKSGGNKPKDDISKYNLTYPDDIVLNSMNVIVGSVGLSEYFGVVSPVYYILKQIKSEDKIKYFEKLFRTEIFQKSLIGLGNGILIKKTESSGKLNTIRMRIPMDKLNQVVIPHPPIPEQTQIVSFLDTKTQKIDELIEKTEQKIKLLKEKRTSLINHCVTKGLNPNVEMKDSGVEWIGEIPSHWDKTRLKYQGEVLIGLSYKPENQVRENEGTLVMRSSNVQNGKPSFEDNVYVNIEIPERLITKENDILICSRNGSKRLIGKNCLITKDIEGMSWGVFMTVYRSKSPKYFHWVLNSPVFKSQSGLFLTSTINQLTVSTLENMMVPFVSDLEEQNQIVEYLDEQTQKIDSTIEKETQRIELLKEYRQSLISDVVTGKVDVRGWNK